MAWIKDFRKARGLSQMQLAQFAGISRSYLSILEGRQNLPPDLNTLFLELQKEFDAADLSTDYLAFISPQHKTARFKEDLQLRLDRKGEQVAVLRRQLALLEKRYHHLLRLRQVCMRWRELKSGTDQALSAKMGALEAGQKTELRQCGPTARAKIRIHIACLEAEIEITSEEIKFFSGDPV